MLQIAMSSLEPLTLDTFMQAVNFVLQNTKGSDTSNRQYTFYEIGEPLIMDSEASQLRRLASRTGGILETFATIETFATFSEESSADHENQASPGLPLVEEASNSGTSPSSLTKKNATTHAVQFLHATAKDFVQSQQHKLLLGSVDSGLTLMGGYDSLVLCCSSSASWVHPILRHMFYYLKMAGDVDVDKRSAGAFINLENSLKNICAPSGANHVEWLLSKHEGHFCSKLMSYIIEGDNPSRDYAVLILAVAANAKKLVKHVLDISNIKIRPPRKEMDQICLLQVAAAGPDLVPIDLQDRTGMIEILVSSGYPIDQKASLCTGIRPSKYSDKRTPFQVVLTRRIESAYSEDTRLDIVKCLLDHGSDVNQELTSTSLLSMSPILHCVRNESAALVRLLLAYKADTSSRDHYGMGPIHYALIHQDKAIMKALVDHGYGQLMPYIQPSVEAALESGVRQTALIGSIGHPMVAVVSAQAPENLVRRNSLRGLVQPDHPMFNLSNSSTESQPSRRQSFQ